MYNDKKLNILSTVVSEVSYLVGNPAVFRYVFFRMVFKKSNIGVSLITK